MYIPKHWDSHTKLCQVSTWPVVVKKLLPSSKLSKFGYRYECKVCYVHPWGTNLVAAAKPLFTAGSAKRNTRLLAG